MKILGISGKEVVGFSPSLGNRQEHSFQRGWIHGMRAEGTLGTGRSILVVAAGAAPSVSLAPPSLPTLPFPVFAVNREYL